VEVEAGVVLVVQAVLVARGITQEHLAVQEIITVEMVGLIQAVVVVGFL
jgi:sulfur transfer complex TusBCD TusB component (DsrH family)